MKEAKKQDSPSQAEPQLRDTAEEWGQADCQQSGGFSKAEGGVEMKGLKIILWITAI
jgi:hypothetical protein